MCRAAMIRSLEIGHKSGKSQGILKWKMSGNPAGGVFHFYSNFDRMFCKQTVETVNMNTDRSGQKEQSH